MKLTFSLATHARTVIAALVLTLSASASSSFGQEQHALTLEDAIATGLQNSKSLKQSLARADAAREQAKSVTTTMLPAVSAGASYARLSEVPGFEISVPFPEPNGSTFTVSEAILDNWSLRVGVEQPVFTGGRLKANVDAHRSLSHVENANLTTHRRELVYRIHQAYWQLYKAEEFLKVVDETVDLVSAHLKDVRNLQDQGMATNSEVLAVQVQLSDTRLLQIDAADNVKLARIALNNLLGLPLSARTQIVSRPDTTVPQVSEESGDPVARALENRTELRALEYASAATKASVNAAKSEWFPQIGAFANFYYANPNQRIQPPVDEFEDSWDVGVKASWSLWNWGGTSFRTRKARADHARTQHALAEAKDAIAAEVTADQLNLIEARAKISVATEGAELAQENYRVMREKFRNGLAPNSDLLDAENNLLKAKWNSTQSLVDFAVAIARLEKSSGTE